MKYMAKENLENNTFEWVVLVIYISKSESLS